MEKMQSPPTRYERGFLDRLDGRCSVAQLMRDQYQQMTNDLGGIESLSMAQLMLVERALWLNYWLRQEEQKLADGDDFDVGKVAAATNTLQGVLAKLGLKRVAKDIPDLGSYLRNRKQQGEAAPQW